MGRGGLKFFRRIGLIRDIKLCVPRAEAMAMIYHDNGELESMSRKAYRTVIAQSNGLAPPSSSSTFKSNYSLMKVVWTEATDIAPLKSTMLGLLGELKIIFSYSSWTKDRSCSSF